MNFILAKVNRFIDEGIYTFGSAKYSITSIHILLELYKQLKIPSIIHNLFFTFKNNQESMICAKHALTDYKFE